MKSKNADLSTRVKIFFEKTMKYGFGAQCPTQNMFGAQRPTQNNCGAQRPRRAEALRTKNFGAQRLTLVRNARPPIWNEQVITLQITRDNEESND